MVVARCTPTPPPPTHTQQHSNHTHNPHSHHSSKSLAYAEDIPGSRCDPDDGPWPRTYQLLNEPELWRELRTLARPQTLALGPGAKFKADSINFQPSHSTKTQDRYVVTQFEVGGRMWSFTGVFDGHLGDVTVEHVAHHLPVIVRDFLREADPSTFDPANEANLGKTISDLFTKAIMAFDDAIAHDVLDLFGGSVDNLDDYTDDQIRNIINDWSEEGGGNWRKARLCMYGTTALVSLVDPDYKNLWVANLGDCQAILLSPDRDTKTWNIEVLTNSHNGDNDAEIERVLQAHPGEPECIVDRRVLGALAPTRCFGDIPFKQPPAFTRRILYNLLPGFQNTSPWEEFLRRNHTPPYVTAEPEIIHRKLDAAPTPAPAADATPTDSSASSIPPPTSASTHSPTPSRPAANSKSPFNFFSRSGASTPSATSASALVSASASPSIPPASPAFTSSTSISTPASPNPASTTTPAPTTPAPAPLPRFLILASDGFSDLCQREGYESILTSWANGMLTPHPALGVSDCETGSAKDNMALRLLRRAIGGEDRYGVSKVLTLDMDGAWIDDTSIVVQTL